jgi:hypothetical protein
MEKFCGAGVSPAERSRNGCTTTSVRSISVCPGGAPSRGFNQETVLS